MDFCSNLQVATCRWICPSKVCCQSTSEIMWLCNAILDLANADFNEEVVENDLIYFPSCHGICLLFKHKANDFPELASPSLIGWCSKRKNSVKTLSWCCAGLQSEFIEASRKSQDSSFSSGSVSRLYSFHSSTEKIEGHWKELELLISNWITFGIPSTIYKLTSIFSLLKVLFQLLSHES